MQRLLQDRPMEASSGSKHIILATSCWQTCSCFVWWLCQVAPETKSRKESTLIFSEQSVCWKARYMVLKSMIYGAEKHHTWCWQALLLLFVVRHAPGGPSDAGKAKGELYSVSDPAAASLEQSRNVQMWFHNMLSPALTRRPRTDPAHPEVDGKKFLGRFVQPGPKKDRITQSNPYSLFSCRSAGFQFSISAETLLEEWNLKFSGEPQGVYHGAIAQEAWWTSRWWGGMILRL